MLLPAASMLPLSPLHRWPTAVAHTRRSHPSHPAWSSSCHSISFFITLPRAPRAIPMKLCPLPGRFPPCPCVPRFQCARGSRWILLRRSTLTEQRHPMSGGSACRLVRELEGRTVMISILEAKVVNVSNPRVTHSVVIYHVQFVAVKTTTKVSVHPFGRENDSDVRNNSLSTTVVLQLQRADHVVGVLAQILSATAHVHCLFPPAARPTLEAFSMAVLRADCSAA